MTTGTTGSTSSRSSDHLNNAELLPLHQLHEHELNFHDHDDDDDEDDDDDSRRVCNACVQFISAPFYGCSQCPNFLLHDCCASLPRTLTQHPAHHRDHPLSLVPKAGKSLVSTFFSNCCGRTCNEFSYICAAFSFEVDLLCAFMPASITHGARSEAHVLSAMSTHMYQIMEKCHCCGELLTRFCYECGTCRNFRLHARCALLPNTVRHVFDQHPLKLITAAASKRSVSNDTALQLCEICESDIDNRWWYYNCNECDQSFHIDCISCLDLLSRIKFRVTTIHVKCHDCPLSLISGLTVCGYHCKYCERRFNRDEFMAFECAPCYFRIHTYCAQECLRDVE